MKSCWTFAVIGTVAMPVVAMAQVTKVSDIPPPPSAAQRDPLSLPGDNLPPPLPAMLAPSRPRAPGSALAEAAGDSPAAPPLAIALKGAEAALAHCRKQGFMVGAAVADSLGGLVIGMQADGAHPGRVYNAMRKNLAAVAFEEPSSAVRDRLRRGDYGTLARVTPAMTLFPGAVPLMAHGRLVGAIAVSGGPGGEFDEGCAIAGAAAIRDDLR